MTAPGEIIDLVERFDRNRDAYRSPSYNETQLRREFLDPFFTALGWDVDNRAGWAEAYKEVIHEDAIKIGGFTKAPDYCFRVGGSRKFFVEAKKPAVDIRQDTSPAFQLRRYAWSAKLPLSVLTDFEEFAVYDCRIKPSAADKASAGRIRYFTYAEYSDKWEEIASVFSKEAVLKGSFDKYAETTRSKRGTAEVDAAFLQEIETWRDLLARNLAIRNPRLSQRELNFAVQRTIDRIIFLRICEDRGIEPEGRLLALTNAPGIYGRLLELYRQADERYNSGLFHFRQEKGRTEEFDRLTPGLTIEDKVLKDILKNLYYPDSPYEFSVLPADILGQVYEQFLGKVIRLTAGHQAKVEDKPEVKKAGGVFYTPTYIVEYIVRNTVGRLLEGKTPKEAEKMTILDPACGSGSFLLGAYQLLLDWHRDWYVTHGREKYATGKRPALYQGMGGEWRLTTAERKRILTNNIFGVDIDPQAVETTKLSLLLKVLEGESEQTLSSQFKLFHERALPDLGGNIKCGNSLIGSDFYQGASGVLPMFGEEERLRINVFDWEKEFPRILGGADPGFDVVIGNPPYGATFSKIELDYLRSNCSTATGEVDSYILFIEKSLSMVKRFGYYSSILPDTWLTLIYAYTLRKLLLTNYTILEIVGLNEFIFPNATIDPLVLTVHSKIPESVHEVDIKLLQKNRKVSTINDLFINAKRNQFSWVNNNSAQVRIYMTEDVDSIEEKIRNKSMALREIFDYRAGCKPYEEGKGIPPQTKETIIEKPFTSFNFHGLGWKVLIRGNDVQRYQLKIKKPEWINYGKWLAAPRDPNIFFGERIIIQAIRNPSLKRRIIATLCDEEIISRINVYAFIRKPGIEISNKYILGILNSTLMNWYLCKSYGLHTYVITGILDMPIRNIVFSEAVDKNRYDRMVKLVDSILSLNKRIAAANTGHEKTALQRQIDATDRRIDQLVYELYGLTDDEISIVEGATGPWK